MSICEGESQQGFLMGSKIKVDKNSQSFWPEQLLDGAAITEAKSLYLEEAWRGSSEYSVGYVV